MTHENSSVGIHSIQYGHTDMTKPRVALLNGSVQVPSNIIREKQSIQLLQLRVF
jgi:hypothetical protein